MSGKSCPETIESRQTMENATPHMKKRPKKKSKLRSLKELFQCGRRAKEASSSKQSCAWTVIDSMGTVSISEYQDEGYGDYEEYKSYSCSDFQSDELSSPRHCEKPSHSDESMLVCCDAKSSTDLREGMVEDTIEPTKRNMLAPERKEILEVKSLTTRGIIHYRHGQHQDALNLQLQALDFMQSILCDHQCIDSRLLLREAEVEYEISKSKYALLKESSNESEDECCERHLAYDKVQNEKLNLLNKTVMYYQDELLRLNSVDKNDVLNMEKVGYTLYILHTLGKIHNKKLARYSHALDYYNEALELETKVLSYMEAQHNNFSTDHACEVKKWNITVQATRKKIGSVHYLTGRLDLAMKRTFTPNIISLR